MCIHSKEDPDFVDGLEMKKRDEGGLDLPREFWLFWF